MKRNRLVGRRQHADSVVLPPLAIGAEATVSRWSTADAELARSAGHLRLLARNNHAAKTAKPRPTGGSDTASTNGPRGVQLKPLHRHVPSCSDASVLRSNNNGDEDVALTEIWRAATTTARHQRQKVVTEAPSSSNPVSSVGRQPEVLEDGRDEDEQRGTTLARYRRLVGMHARKALNRILVDVAASVVQRRLEDRCSTQIQRLARRFVGRRRRERWRYRQLVAAAERLQRCWRSVLARQELQRLRIQRDELTRVVIRAQQRREQLVRRIQRWFRGRRDRRMRDIRRQTEALARIRRAQASRQFGRTVLLWWSIRNVQLSSLGRAEELELSTRQDLCASGSSQVLARASAMPALGGSLGCRFSKSDEVDSIAWAEDAPCSFQSTRIECAAKPPKDYPVGRPTADDGPANEANAIASMRTQREGEPISQDDLQAIKVANANVEVQLSPPSRPHVGSYGDGPPHQARPHPVSPSTRAERKEAVNSVSWKIAPTGVETERAPLQRVQPMAPGLAAVVEQQQEPDMKKNTSQLPESTTALGDQEQEHQLDLSLVDQRSAASLSSSASTRPHRVATRRVISDFLVSHCVPQWRTRLAIRQNAAVRIQRLARRWLAQREVSRLRQLHVASLRSELWAQWLASDAKLVAMTFGVDEPETVVQETTADDEQDEGLDYEDEDDEDDDDDDPSTKTGISWTDVLPTRCGAFPSGLRLDFSRGGPSSSAAPSLGLWKWSWTSERWEANRGLFDLCTDHDQPPS